MLVSGCATTGRQSAEPPTVLVPEWVSKACAVPELPDAPTDGDVDAALIEGQAEIARCDAARKSALDLWMEERAAVRRWLSR